MSMGDGAYLENRLSQLYVDKYFPKHSHHVPVATTSPYEASISFPPFHWCVNPALWLIYVCIIPKIARAQ